VEAKRLTDRDGPGPGRWAGYRRRFGLGRSAEAVPRARTLCIGSGKGGVGKSILATNLALLRAAAGERVCLIDFDAGLANAHLLLGLTPRFDLGHVLAGEVAAEEALVEGPHGLRLLSGGVGRESLANPTRRELDRLFRALAPLEERFDLILIDHGAGLTYAASAHLAASRELLLVTQPEITALSDGYAFYKRACVVNPEVRVGVVLNRVPDEGTANAAWERLCGVARRFLGREPEWVASVPADPAVGASVGERLPVVASAPESPAAGALREVARWWPFTADPPPDAFFARARRVLR